MGSIHIRSHRAPGSSDTGQTCLSRLLSSSDSHLPQMHSPSASPSTRLQSRLCASVRHGASASSLKFTVASKSYSGPNDTSQSFLPVLASPELQLLPALLSEATALPLNFSIILSWQCALEFSVVLTLL
jgi:hypothetical protein